MSDESACISRKSPFRAIARAPWSALDATIGIAREKPDMAKVIGVGGIFFKSKDPAALINWYRDVLGLHVHDWGGVFMTPDAMAAHPGAGTVFAPFKQDTTYFEPSTKDFMINLAVDDLDGILASCARHGVEAKVLPPEPNGRFAHISDPEGTRIELWEPEPMV
jgi:catechol 2,3-dioxygenase-like lactoylglutathione lyase family enzyme